MNTMTMNRMMELTGAELLHANANYMTAREGTINAAMWAPVVEVKNTRTANRDARIAASPLSSLTKSERLRAAVLMARDRHDRVAANLQAAEARATALGFTLKNASPISEARYYERAADGATLRIASHPIVNPASAEAALHMIVKADSIVELATTKDYGPDGTYSWPIIGMTPTVIS